MKIGVFQVIMSLKKLLSPLVSTTEPMTVIKYGSAFIPLEKHKKKCSGFIYYFLNENEKHRRIDFKLISPKENSNSYKKYKVF